MLKLKINKGIHVGLAPIINYVYDCKIKRPTEKPVTFFSNINDCKISFSANPFNYDKATQK